jgi:hypothetical protein
MKRIPPISPTSLCMSPITCAIHTPPQAHAHPMPKGTRMRNTSESSKGTCIRGSNTHTGEQYTYGGAIPHTCMRYPETCGIAETARQTPAVVAPIAPPRTQLIALTHLHGAAHVGRRQELTPTAVAHIVLPAGSTNRHKCSARRPRRRDRAASAKAKRRHQRAASGVVRGRGGAGAASPESPALRQPSSWTLLGFTIRCLRSGGWGLASRVEGSAGSRAGSWARSCARWRAGSREGSGRAAAGPAAGRAASGRAASGRSFPTSCP